MEHCYPAPAHDYDSTTEAQLRWDEILGPYEILKVTHGIPE